MKLNDHFFSYQIIEEFYPFCIHQCFMKFIIYIDLLIIIGAVILFIDGIVIMIRFIGVIVLLVFNIFFFLLYKCLNYDNIGRIDCIYSKNFDRIFIGLVKSFSKKYINTFEYQMNNISRFILEKEINSNDTTFNLRVVFKNNETQQICNIKNKAQEDLEGLAYLLNERLIINTNPKNNNSIDSNQKI